MTIVELKHIQYSIPLLKDKILTVLKDINLTVKKGEFHLISGPSGSGKTTLLQIIGTILHQTSGSRKIFDKKIPNINHNNEIFYVRPKIGFLFQTPFIPSHLKVKEFITIQSELSNVGVATAEKRTNDILREFGVEQFANQYPAKLSGGEKQRVALASILSKDIELLLLDEPTGSLDAENKTIFWDLIKNLQDKQITIIAVSHDESFSNITDISHKLDYGILSASN
jgi:ABC-type lipoprotein export system ATPase subunit